MKYVLDFYEGEWVEVLALWEVAPGLWDHDHEAFCATPPVIPQ